MISMNVWLFLLLTAIGIWGSIYSITRKKLKKNDIKEINLRGIKVGIFLLIFDFIFENSGLLLGFWHTTGSYFQIFAVPIEVMGIAFLAGFTYAILFKEFELDLAIFSSLAIAAIGTGIEAFLVSQNLLIYEGGWTSLHAYISYFLVFLLIGKVNSLVSK